MAEFCTQCAVEHDFTPDYVGLSTEEDTKNDMFCVVICEGCGVTQVDHEGKCIGNCLIAAHGKYEITS